MCHQLRADQFRKQQVGEGWQQAADYTPKAKAFFLQGVITSARFCLLLSKKTFTPKSKNFRESMKPIHTQNSYETVGGSNEPTSLLKQRKRVIDM